MGLTVNIEESNGIKVLKCTGFIDFEASEQVKTTFNDLFSSGSYKIIIDLERTDYISSAGWGIFVGYLNDARKNKGDIKIANMKKEVMEIYELLDFGNIFSYYKNSEEAKKAFAG